MARTKKIARKSTGGKAPRPNAAPGDVARPGPTDLSLGTAMDVGETSSGAGESAPSNLQLTGKAKQRAKKQAAKAAAAAIVTSDQHGASSSSGSTGLDKAAQASNSSDTVKADEGETPGTDLPAGQPTASTTTESAAGPGAIAGIAGDKSKKRTSTTAQEVKVEAAAQKQRASKGKAKEETHERLPEEDTKEDVDM